MASPEPEPTGVLGVTLTGIDNAASFYEEGKYQGYCALCSYLERPQIVGTWEVHHVISKQHCRIEGVPRYSPDDALRVCAKTPGSCHTRHTTHQELLPVACLRDENLAFAVWWLGIGPALVYFETYYADADADPRIDSILEQHARGGA